MESLTLLQMCGLAGVTGYIGCFTSLQFQILRGDSCAYSLLNILSASLVLISLTEHFNLASAIIQVSWIVIGISGLVFRMVRKQKNNGPLGEYIDGNLR